MRESLEKMAVSKVVTTKIQALMACAPGKRRCGSVKKSARTSQMFWRAQGRPLPMQPAGLQPRNKELPQVQLIHSSRVLLKRRKSSKNQPKSRKPPNRSRLKTRDQVQALGCTGAEAVTDIQTT